MTLIGPAQRIHRALSAKCARSLTSGTPLRLFFSGEPGTGKSTVAALLARQLTGHQLGVEKINGADVGADTIRAWRTGFLTPSLFTDWRVLLIEEADRISTQAQVLILTLLDDLPPQRAVLCTSNLQTQELTSRFQTRFQLWVFGGPTEQEIAGYLTGLFPTLRIPGIRLIAQNCHGNVRAALLDAESAADFATA